MHSSGTLPRTDQVWSDRAVPCGGGAGAGGGAGGGADRRPPAAGPASPGPGRHRGSRSGAGGGCQALQLRVKSADHPLQGLATLPREQH